MLMRVIILQHARSNCSRNRGVRTSAVSARNFKQTSSDKTLQAKADPVSAYPIVKKWFLAAVVIWRFVEVCGVSMDLDDFV